MSEVIYGDVTLKLVKTKRFEQTPVFSDDGIDYLYTHFVVDVDCIFNADVMPGYGTSPTQIMRLLRADLLTPRRTLRFVIESETLLEVWVPDASGGPYPKDLTINEIVGSKTFHVHWRCEADVRLCDGGSAPEEYRSLLSNRWEQSQSYDQDFYAIRSTSGVLRVMPENTSVPVTLDSFRHLCLPPLPKGWKRASCRFGVSSDGLTLRYSIEDKEVTSLPPFPATSISARYTESTGVLATTHFAEISIDASGPPNASKQDLVAVCCQVAVSRIDDGLVDSAEIAEDLYENRVSLRVRVRLIPDNAKFQGAGWFFTRTRIALPPPSPESGEAVDLLQRTGLLNSAIAWFKQPCDYPRGVPGSTPMVEQHSSYSDNPEPEVYELLPEPDSEDPEFTDDHKNAIYTDYDIDMHIHTDNHVITLPVAADPEEGGDDGQPTLDPFSPNYDPSTINGGGASLEKNASGTPAVVAVQLAAPMQKIIVKYRGERANKWPQVPSPAPEDGYIVTKHTTTLEAARLLAGNHKAYGISGEIHIVPKFPKCFWKDGTENQLQGPEMPYIQFDSDSHEPIPSSNWITKILFP